MTETKTIAVDGKSYFVTLERFDEYTEPRGPSYHGYYVNIEGHGLTVIARKYDYADEMSIQAGIQESDSEGIEIARDIARQLFRTDRLSLLTRDDRPPYKKI
jgi:hypothetical protein